MIQNEDEDVNFIQQNEFPENFIHTHQMILYINYLFIDLYYYISSTANSTHFFIDFSLISSCFLQSIWFHYELN